MTLLGPSVTIGDERFGGGDGVLLLDLLGEGRVGGGSSLCFAADDFCYLPGSVHTKL